jgi:hypothetical protein
MSQQSHETPHPFGYALPVTTPAHRPGAARSEYSFLQQETIPMQALKKARKLIEKKPEKASALALSQLILALESESPYNLSSLYQMDYDDFELALEVIKDWRLDRYYSTKAVLLDLSMQIDETAGKAKKEDTVPA